MTSQVINQSDETIDPTIGDPLLEGTSGDDILNGGGGDDVLLADDGDDMLNAGGGDDILEGGAGDDTLHGGGGYDTALYSGNIQEYLDDFDALQLDNTKGGLIFNATATDEGIDYLKQIEALQFNNGTYVIGAENQAAFVSDDSAEVDEGSTDLIDVLSNDFDLEGDALTLMTAASTSSIGGVVKIVGGMIEYDANGIDMETGETATDTIEYTVMDNYGNTSTGTLTVTVNGLSAGAGKVVDGYISGATIFADQNADGVLDTGELTTQTGGSGDFYLDNWVGALGMIGGVDVSTGLAFEGTMRAPAGSTTITSLSTLVSELMDSGLSKADATNLVTSNFGVSNILTTDPIEASLNGSFGMMAVASQVLNTVLQISALLEGAGSDDAALNIKTIFEQMADMISTTGFSLTSATDIATLIDISADALSLNVSSTKSGAATLITTGNVATQEVLDNADTDNGTSFLESVTRISVVTQGDVSDDLITAGAAGTNAAIDTVVETYTSIDPDTGVISIDQDIIDTAIIGNVNGLYGNQVMTEEHKAVTTDVLRYHELGDLSATHTLNYNFTNGQGSGSVVGNKLVWTPYDDPALSEGETGTSTIYYFITENATGVSIGNATLEVIRVGTNDAPVTTDDTAIANEDFILSNIDVLGNDNDPDFSDSLTLISATTGSGAIVTINPDGTLNYDPNGLYEGLNAGDTATDTVTYVIQDTSGASSEGSLEVTIRGADDSSSRVLDFEDTSIVEILGDGAAGFFTVGMNYMANYGGFEWGPGLQFWETDKDSQTGDGLDTFSAVSGGDHIVVMGSGEFSFASVSQADNFDFESVQLGLRYDIGSYWSDESGTWIEYQSTGINVIGYNDGAVVAETSINFSSIDAVGDAYSRNVTLGADFNSVDKVVFKMINQDGSENPYAEYLGLMDDLLIIV